MDLDNRSLIRIIEKYTMRRLVKIVKLAEDKNWGVCSQILNDCSFDPDPLWTRRFYLLLVETFRYWANKEVFANTGSEQNTVDMLRSSLYNVPVCPFNIYLHSDLDNLKERDKVFEKWFNRNETSKLKDNSLKTPSKLNKTPKSLKTNDFPEASLLTGNMTPDTLLSTPGNSKLVKIQSIDGFPKADEHASGDEFEEYLEIQDINFEDERILNLKDTDKQPAKLRSTSKANQVINNFFFHVHPETPKIDHGSSEQKQHIFSTMKNLKNEEPGLGTKSDVLSLEKETIKAFVDIKKRRYGVLEAIYDIESNLKAIRKAKVSYSIYVHEHCIDLKEYLKYCVMDLKGLKPYIEKELRFFEEFNRSYDQCVANDSDYFDHLQQLRSNVDILMSSIFGSDDEERKLYLSVKRVSLKNYLQREKAASVVSSTPSAHLSQNVLTRDSRESYYTNHKSKRSFWTESNVSIKDTINDTSFDSCTFNSNSELTLTKKDSRKSESRHSKEYFNRPTDSSMHSMNNHVDTSEQHKTSDNNINNSKYRRIRILNKPSCFNNDYTHQTSECNSSHKANPTEDRPQQFVRKDHHLSKNKRPKYKESTPLKSIAKQVIKDNLYQRKNKNNEHITDEKIGTRFHKKNAHQLIYTNHQSFEPAMLSFKKNGKIMTNTFTKEKVVDKAMPKASNISSKQALHKNSSKMSDANVQFNHLYNDRSNCKDSHNKESLMNDQYIADKSFKRMRRTVNYTDNDFSFTKNMKRKKDSKINYGHTDSYSNLEIENYSFSMNDTQYINEDQDFKRFIL